MAVYLLNFHYIEGTYKPASKSRDGFCSHPGHGHTTIQLHFTRILGRKKGFPGNKIRLKHNPWQNSALWLSGDLSAAAATVSEHGFSSSDSTVGQQRRASGDEGMASQMGRVDCGLDQPDFNKEGWEQNGDETQTRWLCRQNRKQHSSGLKCKSLWVVPVTSG